MFGTFEIYPYLCSEEYNKDTYVYDHKEPTQEEIDSYRQERDIFMDHSKKSMANVIARYL